MNMFSNPIKPEELEAAYAGGMLHKSELEAGCYYKGYCRNAVMAKWDGVKFLYVRTKFGESFVEDILHPEDDNGFDLFIPTGKAEPKDHEKIDGIE